MTDHQYQSDRLRLGLKLSFAGAEYERNFIHFYHETYYRYAQCSLAVGIGLILADFVVDMLAFDDQSANIYRIMICVPILMIGLASSVTRFVRRRWQTIMSAFIVVVAGSLFWVLLTIDRHGGEGLESWVGLLNFVFLQFYCFVILGVQFKYAFPAGIFILLMFEAAMLAAFGSNWVTFAYWSYHVITSFILAGAIGWWREYLLRKDFAAQSSLQVAKGSLENQNAKLEMEVERRTRTIQETQDATIVILASLVETRDNETGNHVRRTQHFVQALARKLQHHPRFASYLVDHQVEMIFKSAPLHDIGKVGIPDSILLKPGKLDHDEFEIMKTHTTLGYEAICNAERQLGITVEFLGCAKEIALSHQEKWDGSGYPRNLAGTDIPISARLMAVADVYDALITRRIYKPALRHDEAVAIILAGSGSHFDPDIVAAFAELADEFRTIASRFPDAPEDRESQGSPVHGVETRAA